MTPSDLFRKGLSLLAILATTGCGMVESDPHRFEGLAQRVADIRLSDDPSRDAPAPARHASADDTGLRSGLRVEVMDPHALWDARDGGLRGLVDSAGAAMVEAAAPAVVQAVANEAARTATEGLRGRVAVGAQEAETIIQLGAFSSQAAAREAWGRLRDGAAASAMAGLSPRYEPVSVNGRDLVRLKVGAPSDAAASICQAVQASDPWCRAAGRG